MDTILSSLSSRFRARRLAPTLAPALALFLALTSGCGPLLVTTDDAITCPEAGPHCPHAAHHDCGAVAYREGTDPGTIHWIDLETLAETLPEPPIDVVFDVDDTVLFTTPGFQWGSRTYGDAVVKSGAPVREQDLPNDEARQKFREFWTRMNNELDQWSVKKWIAVELIRLHKSRGDRIHFVTKRVKTGSEKLTELISKTFDLPGMDPVLFTDRSSKLPFFQQVHAQLSYGDSDGDIRESIAAGARAIRVMRARNSDNSDPTHNGVFGEEVLIDSEN